MLMKEIYNWLMHHQLVYAMINFSKVTTWQIMLMPLYKSEVKVSFNVSTCHAIEVSNSFLFW